MSWCESNAADAIAIAVLDFFLSLFVFGQKPLYKKACYSRCLCVRLLFFVFCFFWRLTYFSVSSCMYISTTFFLLRFGSLVFLLLHSSFSSCVFVRFFLRFCFSVSSFFPSFSATTSDSICLFVLFCLFFLVLFRLSGQIWSRATLVSHLLFSPKGQTFARLTDSEEPNEIQTRGPPFFVIEPYLNVMPAFKFVSNSVMDQNVDLQMTFLLYMECH